MSKAERLQAFWIMKHWMGHVYPSTLRIRRKDCCAAFHVDYGKRHDNVVEKPIKVNLSRQEKAMTSTSRAGQPSPDKHAETERNGTP